MKIQKAVFCLLPLLIDAIFSQKTVYKKILAIYKINLTARTIKRLDMI
jgi:hypothetical protein